MYDDELLILKINCICWNELFVQCMIRVIDCLLRDFSVFVCVFSLFFFSFSVHIIIFLVGIFSALGVPLMVFAMGNLASLLMSFGDPDEAKKLIKKRISREELQMIQKFGILSEGAKNVGRVDFILLCAIRIGAVDVVLISEIRKRFKYLDSNKTGALTRSELQVNTGDRDSFAMYTRGRTDSNISL